MQYNMYKNNNINKPEKKRIKIAAAAEAVIAREPGARHCYMTCCARGAAAVIILYMRGVRARAFALEAAARPVEGH